MTTRRRGPGKPFAPGKSGNPGGRPATIKELQTHAREIVSVDGLEQISDIAHHARDPRVRLYAWEILIDRGWGRAPQAVKIEGGDVPMRLIVDLSAGPAHLNEPETERLADPATKALPSRREGKEIVMIEQTASRGRT
jgi:hypothetical protein